MEKYMYTYPTNRGSNDTLRVLHELRTQYESPQGHIRAIVSAYFLLLWNTIVCAFCARTFVVRALCAVSS